MKSEIVEPNMEEAVILLRELVEAGAEYPDAHTQVAMKFKLKNDQADELSEMYDNSALSSVDENDLNDESPSP